MNSATCYAGAMKRIFAFLVLVGAPVIAQQSNPEIVVDGPANVSPSDARQHVAQVTDTRQGQVARFHRPICPVVVGLPDETNRKISARIRNTARSIGAEVAPEQCESNLVVLVADDGNASLAELRRTRQSWFEGLSPTDIDALTADKGPVRNWSVISLRNEDGERIEAVKERIEPRSMRVKSASALRRVTRLDIEGSVIIIDRSAANGKSIAQLADYAAMRGLARTRRPNNGSLPTILSLFDTSGTSPVHALSASDISYLHSLYRLSGTESLNTARSRLSQSIVRQGH